MSFFNLARNHIPSTHHPSHRIFFTQFSLLCIAFFSHDHCFSVISHCFFSAFFPWCAKNTMPLLRWYSMSLKNLPRAEMRCEEDEVQEKEEKKYFVCTANIYLGHRWGNGKRMWMACRTLCRWVAELPCVRRHTMKWSEILFPFLI